MRRQILDHKLGKHITGCCPGHDSWPNETYKSNRSKRARSRDIKNEHRLVRRKGKQNEGPAQRDYYMIHDPEHLCQDCVHDGLRDPSGLAKGSTCHKRHDNNFPKFIKKCEDYLRGEESIVNEIEGKGW